MVTGDNLQTAKAIAEECGICTEGGIAIEGKTFRAMTIEQQYNVIPSIDVKLKPYFSLSSKKLSLFLFFLGVKFCTVSIIWNCFGRKFSDFLIFCQNSEFF
jgi:hypothetical protein